MSTQLISERNWRLDRYEREDKLQIIRKQLYSDYSGGKTAKDSQRILIDQAATLTLLIHDMEKEFADTGKMNKSYISHVSLHQRILFKLGAKPKKKKKEKGPDLESILNE